MYICIYICMYIHIYVYIHVYVRIYLSIYTYTNTRIDTNPGASAHGASLSSTNGRPTISFFGPRFSAVAALLQLCCSCGFGCAGNEETCEKEDESWSEEGKHPLLRKLLLQLCCSSVAVAALL